MRVPARRRLRRSRLAFRDERGQGLVEFALILPVFLLVLVGILEFGSIYSKVISMRQGIREAGRQGSVANFGSTTTCADTIFVVTVPPITDDIKKLVCLAKSQVGVGSTRVTVKFANADLTTTGTPTYAGGNAILICAAYQIQSLTGILQPVLNGRYAKTKAAFRIENALPGVVETAGGEADPTNQNWTWCS